MIETFSDLELFRRGEAPARQSLYGHAPAYRPLQIEPASVPPPGGERIQAQAEGPGFRKQGSIHFGPEISAFQTLSSATATEWPHQCGQLTSAFEALRSAASLSASAARRDPTSTRLWAWSDFAQSPISPVTWVSRKETL